MENGSVEKEQDDLSVPHQQDEQLKEKPQENIDGLQDAAIEDPMKEIPIQAGESPLQQSKANEKNKKQEDILMRLSVGKSDEEKVGPQPNKRTSKMLSILNKGKKVPRKIKLIISLSVAAFVILTILFITVIHPSIQYKSAVEATSSGDYDTAISLFTDLDGYKDSENKIIETEYNKAVSLMNNGKFNDAAIIFGEISEYKDSAKLEESCREGLRLQISSFIYRYNSYAQSTDGIIGEISRTVSESPDQEFSFEAENGTSFDVFTKDYKVYKVICSNDIAIIAGSVYNYMVFSEVVSAIMEGMDDSLSESDRQNFLTNLSDYAVTDKGTNTIDVNGVKYDVYIIYHYLSVIAERK